MRSRVGAAVSRVTYKTIAILGQPAVIGTKAAHCRGIGVQGRDEKQDKNRQKIQFRYFYQKTHPLQRFRWTTVLQL